jgi:Calcineurin-like phosphoesterase
MIPKTRRYSIAKLHVSGWLALLALISSGSLAGTGCGVAEGPIAPGSSGGASSGGASSGGASSGGEGGAPGPVGEMLGAPMIVAPTATSFGINVVFQGEDPKKLRGRYREGGTTDAWAELGEPISRVDDLAEWQVTGLREGTEYEYEVWYGEDGSKLYSGSARTQAPRSQPFRFLLLTDSHIFPRRIYPHQSAPLEAQEATLYQVANNMAQENADFMVNLGDMLDFHVFGFNDPPPTSDDTRDAYLNYRRVLGSSLGNMAHFPVIGNWDGENGDFSSEEIERSRSQRLLYAPGPTPDTYPEGGNELQDYYAFQWGDALFVVLNVMTYTPTAHLLSYDPIGVPDDWTLGQAQLTFLEETLENATSPWRFILIHHTVGGAAGTFEDSAYGRGGGQAARVGEQSKVHDLMLQYGVQAFFYGHDHVFADMVVDDIHYTLPGSAGAPWKFEALYTGYETYWIDSGHARVDVSPERLGVEFVNLEGTVLYEYELTNPN